MGDLSPVLTALLLLQMIRLGFDARIFHYYRDQVSLQNERNEIKVKSGDDSARLLWRMRDGEPK
jgi:hypothetical protein